MKAVVARDGVPRWDERPTPVPGPGEVRLRVAWTALNRADCLQLAGRYPPPPGVTDIPGLEAAGWIDAVGPGVSRWTIGDPVCALLAGGGWAEQVCCPEGQCASLPDGMGLDDAATLPEVWATAYLNLVVEGRLQAGERLLVHAGGSGVGTAAIQLARWLGAEVAVTASATKGPALTALGARAFDRRGPWPAQVAAAWPEGIDLILDPVGGAHLEDNLALLRTDGRIQQIGVMGGPKGVVDLARLLVRRLTVRGSTLRARPPAEKAHLMRAVEAELWPAFAAGQLRTVIDRTFAVTDIADAVAWLTQDQSVGKVRIRVDDAWALDPGADGA